MKAQSIVAKSLGNSNKTETKHRGGSTRVDRKKPCGLSRGGNPAGTLARNPIGMKHGNVIGKKKKESAKARQERAKKI